MSTPFTWLGRWLIFAGVLNFMAAGLLAHSGDTGVVAHVIAGLLCFAGERLRRHIP